MFQAKFNRPQTNYLTFVGLSEFTEAFLYKIHIKSHSVIGML